MLKLDSSPLRVKTLFLLVWNHVPLSSVLSYFFIPKEGDPLFLESRRFPFEMEGEGGTFLMRYDLLFHLDSPIVRTFFLKKCLTTLKVVMSVTYTCSSSKRLPGYLFKEVIWQGGTVSKRYISYPNGDVFLDLTDRGKRLGL